MGFILDTIAVGKRSTTDTSENINTFNTITIAQSHPMGT